MNAYELAEKLDDSLKFLDAMNTQYKNGFGKYRLLPKEVATMLRQQADLIRNLEKSLGFKNSGYETINLEPHKELSDEEIDKVIRKCGYEIEETVMGKFVDIEGINMYNSLFGFARAIIKASRGEE